MGNNLPEISHPLRPPPPTVDSRRPVDGTVRARWRVARVDLRGQQVRVRAGSGGDGSLDGEADQPRAGVRAAVRVHRAAAPHEALHGATRHSRTAHPLPVHVLRRRHLPRHLPPAHGTRGMPSSQGRIKHLVGPTHERIVLTG